MSRYLKFLPLLVLALALPLVLSGCAGRGVVPLPPDAGRNHPRADLLAALRQVEQAKTPADLRTLADRVDYQLTEENKKEKKNEAALALLTLQRGYIAERTTDETGQPVQLDKAIQYYRQVGSVFNSVATMRMVQVDQYRTKTEEERGSQAQAQIFRSEAMGALDRLGNSAVTAQTYIREPAVAFQSPQSAQWKLVSARDTAIAWLDPYYRSDWRYAIMETLVRLSGGTERNFSYVIAIFLLAILAKLITTPFSVAQFRSMRAMQLFQPELKKLQEKYKDDKQQLARAQMELMKEHKVNPASSCLPMILQLVILWQVYYAIRHFLFRFVGVHFLYLSSLANPDTLTFGHTPWPGPLLLLYAVSMYFTQKLISMPAATPEQQQQQRMMSIMMPFLLLVFMASMPAAFVLYWFLQNILMTGHQYLIMRPHREADAAAARAQLAAGPSETKPSKDETPPPPPEAIQRLTQGRKPARKKKRRHS